ncbi:Choline Transporter-like (CTL) Family [Trachipleistophora hominis]|uniref:Protein PNS1 n=1 Tax=Trachipleistophora hominis TaxID=72359 RepID=L7JXR2_TRAHO|nr:Choline Transporter-like (CTL) Family [Trachipleistophora hominis]
MRTTHSHYKETKRKVNDLWALALYVVFMAGVLTYTAFMSKTKSYLDLASHFDMKVLIFTFVCGFLSFGVHLAALLYFPGPAMHLSCIVIPILSIILAVLSGNIIGIVVSVIFSALMLVTYLFYLRKHIKYAAQIAKSAAQLVCTSIFSTLCVLILFLAGWSGMIYFFVTVSTGLSKQDRIIGLAIEALAFVWTLFVLCYSLRVFIASIFVVHYLMRSISPTQRAVEAFKNWLYALGSICFGALIIALITVLRMLVDRERDRSGSVGSFFYSILLVLLDILQDLVNFSNEWAYCYVALTEKATWNRLRNRGASSAGQGTTRSPTVCRYECCSHFFPSCFFWCTRLDCPSYLTRRIHRSGISHSPRTSSSCSRISSSDTVYTPCLILVLSRSSLPTRCSPVM